MGKYSILHISDLHITKFISEENKKVFESRMENADYTRLFIKTLKELQDTLDICIKKIIVSGDLANRSVPSEYKLVGRFLHEIMSEIKLTDSDFVIVPGNHDINRTHLEDQYEEYIVQKGDIPPYKLHDAKLSKFKQFYDTFYEKMNEKFDPHKAICTKRYIEELGLLILGLNSVYRESFLKDDHVGCIDYESLKAELKEIESQYSDCFKVAVFHHSPQIISGHNLGVIANWSRIEELLNEYNVSVYFYGHTHASLRESKSHTKKYEYIGCGSFALSDSAIGNYFNIYTLDEQKDNALKFQLTTFRFMPGYEERFNLGKWNKDDDKSGEVEILKRYIAAKVEMHNKTEKGSEKAEASESFLSINEEDEKIDELIEESTREIITSSKVIDDCSMKFVELVKDRRLFKSGHFHWGKNSKSHGWLDTNSLLSDYESLKLSINSLLYLIRDNNITADLVIGIGMEGNLLASPISIVLGAKYTYIPVTNRENCDFENRINITECKNLLIVTDTVFSGGTVKQIFDNNSDYFSRVDNINLISIFYTGTVIEELINRNNFKFRYICNTIKIKACMNNSRESCPVYVNGLDTVYEL
jgi:3',5'-cyclic AMP phosphodiesterase CpdA/orotate phosphoribosyltransferase